ncbi:MAG: hypothetical protein WCG55_03420 [bacterium]
MTNENPQKLWRGHKYVASPSELNAEHPPFKMDSTLDVDEGMLGDVEAEDSLHREIKNIEAEVSPEEIDSIHDEIHKEHFKRFQKDTTLGKDDDGYEKVELAKKKRWAELVEADKIKLDTEEIFNDNQKPKSLGQWDSLDENDKKGFFEAKKVQDILNVLKGKTVVQRWFRGGNKNK